MTTAIIVMPIHRRQYRENDAKCARDWTEQLINANHDFNEAKRRGFEIQATDPYEAVEGHYLAIIMWKADPPPDPEIPFSSPSELGS